MGEKCVHSYCRCQNTVITVLQEQIANLAARHFFADGFPVSRRVRHFSVSRAKTPKARKKPSSVRKCDGKRIWLSGASNCPLSPCPIAFGRRYPTSICTMKALCQPHSPVPASTTCGFGTEMSYICSNRVSSKGFIEPLIFSACNSVMNAFDASCPCCAGKRLAPKEDKDPSICSACNYMMTNFDLVCPQCGNGGNLAANSLKRRFGS